MNWDHRSWYSSHLWQELGDYAVGPDGLQLGYVLPAEDGGTTSRVLSADPLDDAPSVIISDPAPPNQRVGVPHLLPEASAAWYAVRDNTNMQPNAASLWFVDLSGASPALELPRNSGRFSSGDFRRLREVQGPATPPPLFSPPV